MSDFDEGSTSSLSPKSDQSLRDKIAAVVQQALIAELNERQDYVNGPYFDTDDYGENVGDPLIGIDGSVTPAKLADAVIAALGLPPSCADGCRLAYVRDRIDGLPTGDLADSEGAGK